MQCFAGLARTFIKIGDFSKGLNIAMEKVTSPQLLIDVATVFENMK